MCKVITCFSKPLHILFCYFSNKGCENEEELGLKNPNNTILDSQISSSIVGYVPNTRVRFDHWVGWYAIPNPAVWIQVDFLSHTKVCRIDSLGHGETDSRRVRTFTVSFSNDGVNFEFYRENEYLEVRRIALHYCELHHHLYTVSRFLVDSHFAYR